MKTENKNTSSGPILAPSKPVEATNSENKKTLAELELEAWKANRGCYSDVFGSMEEDYPY